MGECRNRHKRLGFRCREKNDEMLCSRVGLFFARNMSGWRSTGIDLKYKPTLVRCAGDHAGSLGGTFILHSPTCEYAEICIKKKNKMREK